MRLLNVPPFKVGDRVCPLGWTTVCRVIENRHTRGAWESRLGSFWFPCDRLKRVNENTTEETPSGATVEEVMRSGNQYPPTRIVENIPSTDYVREYRYIVQDSVNGIPVYIPQMNPVQAGMYWLPGDTPPTTT